MWEINIQLRPFFKPNKEYHGVVSITRGTWNFSRKIISAKDVFIKTLKITRGNDPLLANQLTLQTEGLMLK